MLANGSWVIHTLHMNTATNTNRLTIRQLVAIIVAVESGTYVGPARDGDAAVAQLEGAGINVAAACRKHG